MAGEAAVPKAGSETGRIFSLEGQAHALADRLPDLVLEAQRVANTVAQGMHGRRRAGPGETFWQFRQFQSSDAATVIDWRRSASSDHLYVREREWEAAHTVWLWPDLSSSMIFHSTLSTTTKRDRALLLMLALAEMLVRGGERVGLLGLTQPSASRKATAVLAETLAAHADDPAVLASQPPRARLSRFSTAILIGDFLDPPETTIERLNEIAAHGLTGHLVQVLDPAEETLPYHGRTEFVGVEGRERWIADRAETLREAYQQRFAAHRAALQTACGRLGWSFLVHHTDRSPTEPLLTLLMRLQGGAADYRWVTTPAARAGAGR